MITKLNREDFDQHRTNYTIVDIRSRDEVAEHPVFENAINIPLEELRRRAPEVPTDRPVVVHCAGGYRSAIGSSILHGRLPENTPIHDLSEAIKDYL
jgi:rhodanese-related sulfurtransferase